jgi:hypothetical protein
MSGIDLRVVTPVVVGLAAFAIMTFGWSNIARNVLQLIAVAWLIASHTGG